MPRDFFSWELKQTACGHKMDREICKFLEGRKRLIGKSLIFGWDAKMGFISSLEDKI